MGVTKNVCSTPSLEKMDEVGVVLKKFGDEKSTLLDQYERLSFEKQLSQAMLCRSLSEANVARNIAPLPLAVPLPPLVKHVRQGKHRPSTAAAFRRVLKQLLKPFVAMKQGKNDDDLANPKGGKVYKNCRTISVRI